MRLCLLPLIAASGCNWLYGLDKTIALDAVPSELPPSSRTKLVWAIATTDGMATAGIDPVLTYKPIGSEPTRTMTPTIYVGGDGALMPAAYDVSDGTFLIPFELREAPHRIQYTLPGESVAHEVQWALGGAMLTVPRTTRFDAPPPPTNSGYTITPTGLNGQLVAPALYTSGAFSYSNDSLKFSQSGATVSFKFSMDGVPVTPPFGAPQTSQGDWILLTEWAGAGAVSYVNGWAKTQIDLMAGQMTPPVAEPTWNTGSPRTLSNLMCSSSPNPSCLPPPPMSAAMTRLIAAVGSGTTSGHMSYGVSPSTELPGFLPGVGATGFIDRPLMLPFAEATMIVSSIMVLDPAGELALEPVLAARYSSARTTTSGAVLTSSLQGITNQFTMNALPFAAPLATNARLGTVVLAADDTTVPPSSSLQQLTFDTETMLSADDFVVTLYEINGASLAPVRVYHVIGPSVKIDGNLLSTNKTYVFGVSARKGLPGTTMGDYGKAQYPFSQTTTFLKTFRVQ